MHAIQLRLRDLGACPCRVSPLMQMDCGVDPATSGESGLPEWGDLDPADVDIVFITYV